MQGNNKPVKTFMHGTLRVAIWKNYNQDKAYYNATLVHRYNAQTDTTKEADWQSSSSIAYRDMPAAAMLLQRACNWIAHKMEQEKARSEGGQV